MSAQLLELLLFAGLAFVIISKLISMLGVTNDDQQNNKASFFGENKGLKDVTSNSSANDFLSSLLNKDRVAANLDGLIVEENKENIITRFAELQQKIADFNPANFIKGAKGAFKLIIASNNNVTMLEQLIDKRYIEIFKDKVSSYSMIVGEADSIEAKIAEIYTFGNNAFIKVHFQEIGIFDSSKAFSEEWTFSKNVAASSKNWQLSNIEQLS